MNGKVITNFNTISQMKSLTNYMDFKLKGVFALIQDSGLDAMALWVLFFIYSNKELNKDIFQKDVEYFFDIRRPTASKILLNLQNEGYIERNIDSLDNRRRSLILTSKAYGYLESKEEQLSEFDRLLFFGIDKKRQVEFIKMLDDLRSNLDRIKVACKRPSR